MTNAPDALYELSHRFLASYPDEAAGALEQVAASDIAETLGTAPQVAAPVFERLTLQTAAQTLEGMDEAPAARLLADCDSARAAAVLARLEDEHRARLLAAMPPAVAAELTALMTYPPDSAGALMDARVITFRTGTTAAAALEQLRRARRPRGGDVFLVDAEGHLVGVVPLPELALAAPDEPLERLARSPAAVVDATAEREDVVERLNQRGLSSLPVVDFDGRLVGVLDDTALVAAVRDEVSADLQTMVGAGAQERALSRVSFAVRKRLPWLEINLVTAFLAAAVVGLFESTIARFTALAVLLPVVAGQSGNTGAQALAVTMRGLAVREIRLRHWLAVARKEIGVAAINGAAVALTTALGVYVWSRSFGLALVIAVSMVLSMVVAGFAGAVTPMVLTRLGQDPAQSSSIILTTVTDVAGFFSFLGIATLLASLL
jgi:magnesium transporter